MKDTEFSNLMRTFENGIKERLDQKEKEIYNALKILKSVGVYEIKTTDGRSFGIDYLLSFRHPWDEEEK